MLCLAPPAPPKPASPTSSSSWPMTWAIADLGVQGGKDIPTPNIDSIAKNGVRCTQGYVSCPYCSPTRAGLKTGRYQTRFGHEFNEPAGRRARQLRPAAQRKDDRRSLQGPRLRHRRDRQVAPGLRARPPADGPRLRRVLRHARQHAVLPPHELRRFAQARRTATDRRRQLLHDRRLCRAGRAVHRSPQGPSVLPLSAVQRPARARRKRRKNTSTASRNIADEQRKLYAGMIVGHGRRRRPRAENAARRTAWKRTR